MTRANETLDESALTIPRMWRVAFAAALPLGVSSAAFVYFGMRAGGRPLTLGTALLAGIPDWLFWAALTPLIIAFSVRVRVERETWLRVLTVHLVAGALIVLAELALLTLFEHWFYYNPWAPAPRDLRDAYARNIYRSFHYAFLIYCVIVAAARAFVFWRTSQSRALQEARLRESNAELQSQLVQTQLDLLRVQLQPHFFFNTLNTISGLIREGRAEEATDVVALLGQLFRRSLATLDRREIPLREELALVDAYVAIEKIRFRDRLEVSREIDAALLDEMVPVMSVQPLVENAIRHGVARAVRGHISVRVVRDGDALRLDVTDSGAMGGASLGGESDANTGFQIGLKNLRARLDGMYGDRATLAMRRHARRGTIVTVRIPCRAEHEARIGA